MNIITHRKVIYSNLDDAAKTDLIKAGVGTAATIAGALVVKGKAPLSEIEMKCGKKPKLGKKKKQAWQDCVNKSAVPVAPVATQPSVYQTPPPPAAENKNKTLIYVGVIVVVFAIAGVVIWKMKSKKGGVK